MLTRMHRLRGTSLAVFAAIAAITCVLTWAAWAANRSSNDRLLGLQVRQTASVLQNQVPVITAQLLDAAQAAENTHADPAVFQRFVASKISDQGPFASISLWRVNGAQRQLIARAGVPPVIAGHAAEQLFAAIKPGPVTYLTNVLPSNRPRFGYAVRAPGDTAGYVVYAERFLPPGRHITLPPDSPFAGLRLAVYLGQTPTQSQLLEATAPTPIAGRTHSETVPFGDSALTVVGSSPQQLAGPLSAALPWIVLGLGLALALSSGAVVEYVGRKRSLAEALAEDNERLFHEQRDIARTLQLALLPAVPRLADVQVAARYVAGTDGTEVGGDWYDILTPSPSRCVFVVGDVSGRGIRAATTMASLRFAIRAYVGQGDDIATVMSKLDTLVDFEENHQFATVLLGEIDTGTGEVALVSAGHFAPVLLTGDRAEFLDCYPRPPIGVGTFDVCARSVRVSGPATLLAFTDGLVERPREIIDAGLERLRVTASGAASEDPEQLVKLVTDALLPEGTKDDAVLLALRWETA